nr:DUF1501 domain-containing protein [Acaryochloris sp. CCMEE 5410]
MMRRRQFLQYAAASGVTAMGLSWLGKQPVYSQGFSGRQPKLIVILLRGAVDGLNVVVPYRELGYYDARPTLAIAKPDEAKGAIDLDGQFGLHPALADLMPLWKSKQLAFVHACGSPDPTRSHFDAQDYMELGTPGNKKQGDGWLNRVLAHLPAGRPTQALNLGNQTPLILSGSKSVANLAFGRQAIRPLPLDRLPIQSAFDRLYEGDTNLGRAYQEGLEAREILKAELNTEMMKASRGAPGPSSLKTNGRRIAQLLSGNAETQIAFVSLGGWDTHVNQGSTQGRLAQLLKPLGEGLNQIKADLGKTFDDTTIVVMSEFGRTVAENGNGGTDHGHGNVLWVLGGQIQGGKVYGEWPGLAESQRYQSRDLEITTDFRDAIAPLLTKGMGIESKHLKQIFPGYSPQTTLGLI